MGQTKNDLAWEKLFEKYQIVETIKSDGIFEISSKQINQFREARLMTKFDHRSQLPEIFSNNNLSILPISRGSYLISDFEIFNDFKELESLPTITFNVVNNLESVNFNNVTSESSAINCAFISGILEDFIDDGRLTSTVNGRMSSDSFSFKIKQGDNLRTIDVVNSQIEIDAGYEGLTSFCVIEAKNSLSKDFLVRQLYYPFRLWLGKVSKKVRPIFMTYTNGVYHFREYAFESFDLYNSLTLVKEKRYVLNDDSLSEEVIDLVFIKSIIDNQIVVGEPEVPFPQADSFERVINLCELLYENEILSQTFITSNYDFDSRQTKYYASAAIYLGLINRVIDEGQVGYALSHIGLELFELSISQRQKQFISLILSHSVFKKVLMNYLESGVPPGKEKIVELMKSSNLYHINSESTFKRRASTVSSWVNWILEQIEE
ncbi:type II restriction enzyme [Arcticibacterium luteifluviistationis]|uniref:Transcriptional regulator n=1 Tax=Arcticibacterium luteifluviistationis TaxID=1784714 RepID=A0A2Z4G9Y3_9BACT|nr:transcriptional regulator [Arcticibacterium luteifluviistationis]AWV97996.1 transcriptional regulator [Arcticibacterium luteifluviistationis]